MTPEHFDDDENTLSLRSKPALAKVQSDGEKSDVSSFIFAFQSASSLSEGRPRERESKKKSIPPEMHSGDNNMFVCICD